MLLLYIFTNRACREDSAVTAQNEIHKTLKQALLANFVPSDQIVDNDRIVKIVQISALCLGSIKLKALWKASPHEIIGN